MAWNPHERYFASSLDKSCGQQDNLGNADVKGPAPAIYGL